MTVEEFNQEWPKGRVENLFRQACYALKKNCDLKLLYINHTLEPYPPKPDIVRINFTYKKLGLKEEQEELALGELIFTTDKFDFDKKNKIPENLSIEKKIILRIAHALFVKAKEN